MSNHIRLRSGQTNPRNPHSTSVPAPKAYSTNIMSVKFDKPTTTPKIYRRASLTPQEYKTVHEQWYNNLNPKQQEATYLYTSCGKDKTFNEAIKGGMEDSQLSPIINCLNDAVKINRKPTLAYRGIKLFDYKSLKPGQTIEFNQFISTTLDPHTIFKFIDKDNPIIFEITATTGAEISSYLEETELLLPFDSSYQVEEILLNQDWNAEYADTQQYSVGVKNATIIRLTQKT